MNILVVEDEGVIALWLGSLIRRSGHRLAGLCKAMADAQRAAAAVPPDMALVDLRLGKDIGSGRNRCGATIDAYLAEHFGTTSIYVTANRAFALTYRRSAIGFIEKPFREDQILQAIGYVNGLRQGSEPAKPAALILFEGLAAPPAPQEWRARRDSTSQPSDP
jgi:DNA-binding NtrC family response regulator